MMVTSLCACVQDFAAREAAFDAKYKVKAWADYGSYLSGGMPCSVPHMRACTCLAGNTCRSVCLCAVTVCSALVTVA